MIALVREEPGVDRVMDALTEPGERCFAHYVNLCEVHVHFVATAGASDALPIHDR